MIQKKYDQVSFEHERKDFPGIEIDFLETDLNRKTAKLAAGYEAVCAFVNSRIGEDTVNILAGLRGGAAADAVRGL